MTISVIIPMLNEAAELPETIRRIRGAGEIIVVDGGSDAIPEIAGATVVQSKRGRASQMNTGAARASGEVFLFLHADTWLQETALEKIANVMREGKVVGGAFHRRFRSRSFFLKMTCALATLRNCAIGWHLGDQAIFCRANIFRELGGFAPMQAFEDLDFSRRLARRGKIVTLRPAVITSARRFDGGAVRRTGKDLLLTLRYLLRPGDFRV